MDIRRKNSFFWIVGITLILLLSLAVFGVRNCYAEEIPGALNDVPTDETGAEDESDGNKDLGEDTTGGEALDDETTDGEGEVLDGEGTDDETTDGEGDEAVDDEATNDENADGEGTGDEAEEEPSDAASPAEETPAEPEVEVVPAASKPVVSKPANTNQAVKAAVPSTKTEAKVPKVERIAGKDRYETAIAIADEYLREKGLKKFKTVVIASGEVYADALSGSFFAYKKGGPIILIGSKNVDSICDYILEKLEKTGRVYILGGVNAVSSKVETKFEGYKLKRIFGKDRYGTNLAILKNSKAEAYDDIAVCSGTSYADAISASAMKMPLLMVGKSLTADQKTYLSGIGKKAFRVIGGDNAVVGTVWKGLKAYGKPNRYYGNDRYETSLAVANRFFSKTGKTAFLATGTNFPDGIAAGPLALLNDAPVVLTAKNCAAYAYNYVFDKSASHVYVIGGTDAVDDKQVGATQPAGFLDIKNYQYYIKSSGRMAQNEWFTDSGMRFRAQKTGVLNKNTSTPVRGIDVSSFNGVIDWAKVKAAGIKFAFIRVGGRFSDTGKIYDDSKAKANLTGAIKAGLKVGVYFFSQAVNAKEGKEEAEYTLNAIKGFDVSLPIAIDSENVDGGGRHHNATNKQRTDALEAFCETVKKAGKTPMIYSGTNWFNTKLDMTRLDKYAIWCADWRGQCYYQGDYICWQDGVSAPGEINGIKGRVDTDWWYGGGI